MYILLHSTTRATTRINQKPEVIAKSDYKHVLVGTLCDRVLSLVGPDASVHAIVPSEGDLTITPTDNVYAMVAAVDRGCDHIVVDIPGGYSPAYREHFTILEV